MTSQVAGLHTLTTGFVSVTFRLASAALDARQRRPAALADGRFDTVHQQAAHGALDQNISRQSRNQEPEIPDDRRH